ncbi:DNA mismatch endonuclease Vsr [Chryseobacterium koreense]|uniref:DNA mismatch endonuclease Vsr n=1 Tax=Chryseobacterium koreense TaxID=232216 RepID=UPI000A01E2A2|nr:DNA mismatch endonuclease Vsr [Chryseobacterium koreense]MBB5332563.1 DNA mismatch endonuclease Vsr [Chryseobacterium koreense]
MDKLTKEQRRKSMQANKSAGTKPELLLAKTLYARGHRYRKNNKTVFGKPDLTFKNIKLAIFVDGEFWHGKDWYERKNDHKTYQEFWNKKNDLGVPYSRTLRSNLFVRSSQKGFPL